MEHEADNRRKGEKEKCTDCYMCGKEKEKFITLPQCGHVICRECFKELFLDNSQCLLPNCGCKFTPDWMNNTSK